VGADPQAFGRKRLIAFLLAAAMAANSPRGFVQQLYSSYENRGFSPLKRPERVFAPPLEAAISEDQRLARGEVRFLDGDPLCDCQDTLGMRSKIVSLVVKGPSAKARVLLRFSGTSDKRDIRLSLVLTPAGWRIADVGTKEEKRILHDLSEANRKARMR
jgi:Protein of unknown function (DUF3828)